MGRRLSRREYADLYGPTTGDRVHLADTGLVIEIERDFNTYGDEAVFGGGKTLCDGMGQAPGVTAGDGALDFVITNAIVLDAELGVVKGDVGIKDGRIGGVGKAGNPDVMDVTPGLVVSANTSEAGASSYLTHFRERVLPALRRVEGHRGAIVLRRAGAGDVELIVLTLWDSLDAIRGFSGADLTAAVVEPEARAVLSAFDTRAIHFDLVLDARA